NPYIRYGTCYNNQYYFEDISNRMGNRYAYNRKCAYYRNFQYVYGMVDRLCQTRYTSNGQTYKRCRCRWCVNRHDHFSHNRIFNLFTENHIIFLAVTSGWVLLLHYARINYRYLCVVNENLFKAFVESMK